MSQQILSQDEVDALLQGITGESQKLEQAEEQAGGIREYNLANQERIVRGRMPTMEIINERFARNIRIGLFNLIRRSPEVSIGGTKVQKYSAFLREIVVPTNFNIVSVKPVRGSGAPRPKKVCVAPRARGDLPCREPERAGSRRERPDMDPPRESNGLADAGRSGRASRQSQLETEGLEPSTPALQTRCSAN